jgi:hypothetical protein
LRCFLTHGIITFQPFGRETLIHGRPLHLNN